MPGLNISPIRPINSMSGNIRPINTFGNTGGISHGPKRVFDSLDIKKIGQGRLLQEGSYHKTLGAPKYAGLKGQLSKLRREGRFTVTKNISKKNIEQIHDLIADRIRKKTVGTGTLINRFDKIAIMKEAKKMVRTKDSGFTKADRKDLKEVVNVLQQKSKDAVLHKNQPALSPLSTVESSTFLSENINTELSKNIVDAKSLVPHDSLENNEDNSSEENI